MQPATPHPQHAWLRQLVGDWTYEIETVMGEGEPERMTGIERVRAIGDLWIMAEARGEMHGGAMATNVLTIGFDPDTGSFVGTFISSAMTKLWVYAGSLDEAQGVLTLETEGPSFTGSGTTTYHDVLEITGPDSRLFYSEAIGPDGAWTRFMTARYRRTA